MAFLQKKSWGLIFLENVGSERSQPIPGMFPWVPVGQIYQVANLNGVEPERTQTNIFFTFLDPNFSRSGWRRFSAFEIC